MTSEAKIWSNFMLQMKCFMINTKKKKEHRSYKTFFLYVARQKKKYPKGKSLTSFIKKLNITKACSIS